jgi:hypothetical protein
MKGCDRCGQPKPPGRGRKYCSPECRAAGPAEGVKRCGDCGQERLIPVQIGAKSTYCKACLKEHARAQAKRHYENNRETVKAAVAAYRAAHVEQVNANKREHYYANRERYHEQQAAYRREHREEQRERAHRWYVLNRDKHKDAARRYREANRELVRERNRDWYQRVMSDPARREERRELARMDERLRAMRQGEQVRPLPADVYRKLYGTGRGSQQARVSAEPLRELLSEAEDLEALAEGVDLSESFLRRVRDGYYDAVSIPDADTICIAFGLPMTLIYGDAA